MPTPNLANTAPASDPGLDQNGVITVAVTLTLTGTPANITTDWNALAATSFASAALLDWS